MVVTQTLKATVRLLYNPNLPSGIEIQSRFNLEIYLSF